MRQGTGKPGFADPGWPYKQGVMVLPNPFAARQSAQKFTIEPARVLIIDVFNHRTFFEFGQLQPSRECSTFFPRPLAVHEQSEALFETELVDLGGFDLLLESIDHPVQLHNLQFFYRWLVQHWHLLNEGYWRKPLGGWS